uniref:Uncharacterized protein n=1 Tax=Anguilla anguilla TaxID=7936 RepID=A0A0E9V5J4_ANGAN
MYRLLQFQPRNQSYLKILKPTLFHASPYSISDLCILI